MHKPTTPIPFNKPHFFGTEFDYISQALARGHISGDGEFTKKAQAKLESDLPGSKVLLTTSCTDALEMAALLLDLRPGDEIIMPSFTFVSTANAFVLHGGRPVFADISPTTLNIDPDHIERLITPRTRAICVVHYAGVGCEMDRICELARRHGLVLIEDNAHGLFGGYKGKALGTFGQLATLSFHETKNITSGEGGALVINDASLVERAEILREKGTNRSKFFRGQVDKYTWVDKGSSFLPSDIIAAVLLAQLERRDEIQSRRKELWDRYHGGLSTWAHQNQIVLPQVPQDCDHAYHMFYMLMPGLEPRQSLIRDLSDYGIKAVFHYIPLHRSPMAMQLGLDYGDCQITESVSDRLIRLPFYFELTPETQDRVINKVLEFKC